MQKFVGEYATELFDLSLDPLCVAGTDGYFIAVNPAFQRLLGYTAEEICSRPFVDLVHPDDRPKTLEEIERLASGHQTIDFENRYRCADGSYRWLSWTCRPDLEQGLLYAVARDITEQRAWQEALRRSKDSLESLFEAVVRASGQLLYIWEPETNTLRFANTETALGYPPESLEGGLERWLELVHPDDRGRFEAEMTRAAGTGEELWLELRLRHADGHYLHVEDRGYFTRRPDGSVEHMVGFLVDVTDRKALEDQLRQAQKMDAIGRLAGGVAHDFNNLLTAILGYSELALDELPVQSAARRRIELIQGAGDRARRLTAQLLAFGRKQILQPRPLDLSEAVERISHLLGRVIGEDIDLRIDLVRGLPPISFDPAQIDQIVLNLAINGRDAMPDGGKLTIETAAAELDEHYVRRHPGAMAGPHVMLAVTDTGSGMDPETQARIFEPFFTTKGLGEGTGLGLATVHGIVLQSGGTIWVYSELGRGTTFKVYLPVAEQAAPAKRPTPVPAAANGTETVLLVEDEAMVRDLVATVLQAAGYRVLAATNAREALALAETAPIDLLLTDVVLPGGNGRQLAEALTAASPTTRVLYMSGYTDNAIVHHGVLDRGVELLEKPITPAALRAKVRAVLDPPDPPSDGGD